MLTYVPHHTYSLGLVSLLQRVDDDDETAEAERECGRRHVLPYCLFKSMCAYVLE